MTRRYNLNLSLYDSNGKLLLLNVQVNNKTMDTIQQLVRLSMSDFEKVEPLVVKKKKHRWGRGQVHPPIEPLAPTEEEIAALR